MQYFSKNLSIKYSNIVILYLHFDLFISTNISKNKMCCDLHAYFNVEILGGFGFMIQNYIYTIHVHKFIFVIYFSLKH